MVWGPRVEPFSGMDRFPMLLQNELRYTKLKFDTILNIKELSLQFNVWFKCVCECIASECSRLQQQRILHLAITSCTTLRSSRSDLKVAPLQIWQPSKMFSNSLGGSSGFHGLIAVNENYRSAEARGFYDKHNMGAFSVSL